VKVTINGTNDAAVLSSAQVALDETNSALSTSGTLSISDVDNVAEFVAQADVTGSYGKFSIDKNGNWSYTANSAFDELNAGQSYSDTFTVKAVDGTETMVKVTINGTNDAAVIGNPTVSSVTEDVGVTNGNLTATGSIAISDVDQGQASFKTSVAKAEGTLGNLLLAANGSYTYSVANSAVQFLKAGQTKTETFTVETLDGTTKQVSFTITGVNDAAVIGTPNVAAVTEDAAAPTLTATGSIAITDADQGQASFKTSIIKAEGTLGDLEIAADGHYTYSVANSAVQFLGAGQTKIETFTVEALDGTTKQVSFTITGVNDAAVIGDPTVAAVTEDANPTTLTASGLLSIADVDQGEASFKSTVTKALGTLGDLTLAANGSYTYSVDNSAVQFLKAGQTKTETFTVEALDGTTKQVSFTITGVNDAAVIGDPTVVAVTEDANSTLTASGSISIADVDQGEASFKPAVTGLNTNLGTLSLQPSGSYTYSVANSAVQFLGAGQTKTETFTVEALDGTTKQVNFTITGVNDVATIVGTATASVKEDTLVNNGKLVVSNKLTVSDVDQSEAFFDTGVSFKNNSLNSAALGVLTIDATGNFSYSVDNNRSQIQSLGVGQTVTETFTVKSLDGTAAQDITITINGTNDAPIVATPSRLTQTTQYSDALQDVIFTATDLDAGDVLSGSIAYSYNGGAFINGLPDAGSVVGGLGFAFDAASNSWKLGGIADLAAGQYQFRFRATDSQGAFSDTLTSLTVAHENARTLFDGQTFVSTDSSGNARVTLRSLIYDATALGLDPTGGNISKATVNFVNRATGAVLASNVPVTLMQQGNQLVGVATLDWNVNIGNADSDTFTIGTVVNGSFYNQNTPLEDTTVTISKPTGQFISGGGYTVLGNSTGQYAGDANSRFNYGFNIKTSKSQNSYQGKFTGLFRRTDIGADGIAGTADDVLRTYQIRSNAADSLVVQAGVNLDSNTSTKEDGVAVFRSKANLVDVTNPLAPVSLGGNLQLEVSVQDFGEPGSSDRINVRLWNGTGTQLLYSNTDIMGSINPLTSSQHQLIAGGNIDIHPL
ncbi:MAG TPA: VCBS domain-containing protein, partial [Trichocoleus sp.]